MRATRIFAAVVAAALLAPSLLDTTSLQAQPPMMGMRRPTIQNLSEETIAKKTDSMVVELGLNEEQAAQLLGVNKKYLGKVTYPVVMEPRPAEARPEGRPEREPGRRDFRNMSEEERQKMMERMEQMQAMAEQMEDNQEAYETALSVILDKKQLKAFRRAKNRYQNEQRLRQEYEMRQRFQRMGPPGGGGGGGF